MTAQGARTRKIVLLATSDVPGPVQPSKGIIIEDGGPRFFGLAVDLFYPRHRIYPRWHL